MSFLPLDTEKLGQYPYKVIDLGSEIVRCASFEHIYMIVVDPGLHCK